MALFRLTTSIAASLQIRCVPIVTRMLRAAITLLAFLSQVAARVRTEDGEEQWILAEVYSYSSQNHRYSVDDIDEEGHNEQR